MPIPYDLHVHTVYSDGTNTPEEVAAAALCRGMTWLGFSDHAPLPFPTDWALPAKKEKDYKDRIERLKEPYAGRLRILSGLELDYFTDRHLSGYDYTIGSAHFVLKDGQYLPVDESSEVLEQNVKEYYRGDYIAFAEDYFSMVADIVRKTDCTIIGHLDLVAKFNEGDRLFSTKDARYVAAWKAACDALLAFGRPFEINTGAVSRGYRTVPYPSDEILSYLEERGAMFLLSSDSHQKDTLQFGFEKLTLPRHIITDPEKLFGSASPEL